jgi:[acyl-carrier-protein] S-malonyltransferase
VTSLPGRRAIGLLFPGQGAQHAAMAAGLYGWEPAFTVAMDEFFETLGADGARLRSDWLELSHDLPIDDIRRSQPLLFAIGHALGRMVLSWGVSPRALLGHSVGELAAATLAGVFALADAARLIQQRTETFARTPAGGMLAVAGSAHDLEPLLTGAVVVGG